MNSLDTPVDVAACWFPYFTILMFYTNIIVCLYVCLLKFFDAFIDKEENFPSKIHYNNHKSGLKYSIV